MTSVHCERRAPEDVRSSSARRREASRKAFHVFKIFVANPHKDDGVRAWRRNREAPRVHGDGERARRRAVPRGAPVPHRCDLQRIVDSHRPGARQHSSAAAAPAASPQPPPRSSRRPPRQTAAAAPSAGCRAARRVPMRRRSPAGASAAADLQRRGGSFGGAGCPRTGTALAGSCTARRRRVTARARRRPSSPLRPAVHAAPARRRPAASAAPASWLPPSASSWPLAPAAPEPAQSLRRALRLASRCGRRAADKAGTERPSPLGRRTSRSLPARRRRRRGRGREEGSGAASLRRPSRRATQRAAAADLSAAAT